MSISSLNTKFRFGRAFSLVELMVVVFIISVTTGILLSSYAADRAKKELEASGREFLGALKEAQNYALTGKQLVRNTTPCGFKVDWASSSSRYSFIYYYRGTNDTACRASMGANSSVTYYSKDLKKGAVFTTSSSLTFTLPHGVPDPAPGAQPNPIILQQMGELHVVCIYEEGRLSDYSGGMCPT